MTSAKIFYFSCLSFILGIAFCAFFSPPAWLAGLFVLSGTSLAISSWPKRRHNFFWSVGKKRVLSAGFILLALGLSFWRSLSWQETNFSTIAFWNDSREKVEISGWVEREKTKTKNTTSQITKILVKILCICSWLFLSSMGFYVGSTLWVEPVILLFLRWFNFTN